MPQVTFVVVKRGIHRSLHPHGHSVGTRLFDGMISRELLRSRGEDLELTVAGADFVRSFGIDLDGLAAGRSKVCRQCLDWSERRYHLAGSLGRAMLGRFEELGWARRDPRTRVVTFSRHGTSEFEQLIDRR